MSEILTGEPKNHKVEGIKYSSYTVKFKPRLRQIVKWRANEDNSFCLPVHGKIVEEEEKSGT